MIGDPGGGEVVDEALWHEGGLGGFVLRDLGARDDLDGGADGFAIAEIESS